MMSGLRTRGNGDTRPSDLLRVCTADEISQTDLTAPTDTRDETGRHTTNICLLFLRGYMQNGNYMEKHCYVYVVFLFDLVMFIKMSTI